MNHKKELPWSLWVGYTTCRGLRDLYTRLGLRVWYIGFIGFRVKDLGPFEGSSSRVLCQLLLSQSVLSTYIVECRVSMLGITIMIWGSIPHNST